MIHILLQPGADDPSADGENPSKSWTSQKALWEPMRLRPGQAHRGEHRIGWAIRDIYIYIDNIINIYIYMIYDIYII